MTRRSWATAVLIPLLFLFLAPPCGAQQKSIEELSKQIETLSRSVKAMQKDLQEIKALLKGRAQAAPSMPPQEVLLDLAGRPARGDTKAKLTMVEFSDYQ
jgi:protein-disulfide isomerase